MSATKSQLKESNNVLAEDGELRSVATAPETQSHFCIHCGTPNRAEASFCRNCGRSLDEQEVDEAEIALVGTALKNKRDQKPQRVKDHREDQKSPIGAGDVVIELATLAVMGFLFYWTATSNLAGLSLGVLLAWLLLTMARHGLMD